MVDILSRTLPTKERPTDEDTGDTALNLREWSPTLFLTALLVLQLTLPQ